MPTTAAAAKTSVSPLSNQSFEIPDVLDDSADIEAFLERHPGKPVVVVQGLGFVGAVMSLVVANALAGEYAVIGVDVPTAGSYWKIRSINEGQFPVVADDPKIQQFYQEARRKGNLYATYDPYAYGSADVIVIDINLDVQKHANGDTGEPDFAVDLSPFRRAVESIGAHCKPDVLVLVETTVPPGACQKIVYPVLRDALEKRGLPTGALKVGHSYERVMPGPKYVDSIQNFYRVYSGMDESSARAVESFLRTIIKTDDYPLTRLASTNATEMAKVLENSFRAMNIAFVVEWSRFAEEAGVNLYEVVNAIRMRPTHKNLMLPGLGVGGYCLTKDPLLASWARQNLFGSPDGLPQSETGVRINDRMPRHAYEFLQKSFPGDLRGKSALLLGVSYLNDVGDTRFTPVAGFYDELVRRGCRLTLHDPHVGLWEERRLTVERDLAKVLHGEYDLIAITTGHKEYRRNPWLIEQLLRKRPLFVYDTIGLLADPEIDALRRGGHTVKVLGRGDL